MDFDQWHYFPNHAIGWAECFLHCYLCAASARFRLWERLIFQQCREFSNRRIIYRHGDPNIGPVTAQRVPVLESESFYRDGYNVYRGTASGGPYPTKLTPSPQPTTSMTDSTVMAADDLLLRRDLGRPEQCGKHLLQSIDGRRSLILSPFPIPFRRSTAANPRDQSSLD